MIPLNVARRKTAAGEARAALALLGDIGRCAGAGCDRFRGRAWWEEFFRAPPMQKAAEKNSRRLLRCEVARSHLLNRVGRVVIDFEFGQGARRKHIRMDLRPRSNAGQAEKRRYPKGKSNLGRLPPKAFGAEGMLVTRALPSAPNCSCPAHPIYEMAWLLSSLPAISRSCRGSRGWARRSRRWCRARCRPGNR